jgi:hypothetical protein
MSSNGGVQAASQICRYVKKAIHPKIQHHVEDLEELEEVVEFQNQDCQHYPEGWNHQKVDPINI